MLLHTFPTVLAEPRFLRLAVFDHPLRTLTTNFFPGEPELFGHCTCVWPEKKPDPRPHHSQPSRYRDRVRSRSGTYGFERFDYARCRR